MLYQVCQQSIGLNTSEVILLLLSGLTNTNDLVPMAVIHDHDIALAPPCLTDDLLDGMRSSFSFPYLSLYIILVNLSFKTFDLFNRICFCFALFVLGPF